MKAYTPENVEFSVNGVKITGFADMEVWKIPMTDKWNMTDYIKGGTNHLQGLDIKVVGKWPTLPKNFNRKENTMQYMTNQMLQRFMSYMAKELFEIQRDRELERRYAIIEAKTYGASSKLTRQFRAKLAKQYQHFSNLQILVKQRETLRHNELQQAEKLVTKWINEQEHNSYMAYDSYLDNRYDPFYRNRSKQAKQKLKKLVELQQAIRKQKSITKF